MVTKSKPKIQVITIRANEADVALIEALQAKMGVLAIADLTRQAWRALAAKEGLAQ